MQATRHMSLLGFILLAQVAAAQVSVKNSCPANAPVQLQPGPVPSGQGRQEVAITNKAEKGITAVILSWRVTDSRGAFYPTTSSVDFAPSGRLFAPGESITTDTDVSVKEGESISSVDVTCLAVLFTGKGLWGDAEAPEVAHLRATRRGIASERKRLLEIYKREGTTRLVDELNRPFAR